MKKRKLHQSTHLFDAFPFEAFHNGSWKPVEGLRIRAGANCAHLVDDGVVYEENIHILNLRLRSRKATSADCTCFLRPGLDVCVLSTCQLTESSGKEEEDPKPVWLDAKINSIERKPHEAECACRFYVQFYIEPGRLGVMNRRLCKDTVVVKIDQISILQKLETNPCENEYYRWDFSEDCSLLHKCRLFPGKFSSDISWLLVASVLKRIEFDIMSIQKRIVYLISDANCDKCSPNLEGNSNGVNFKLENGMLNPIIIPFTHPKEIGCDAHEDEYLSFAGLMGLRRSKRRQVQPERLGGGDLSGLDTDVAQIYKKYRSQHEGMPLSPPIPADHACKSDRHLESEAKVHSHKGDLSENFLGCHGKFKSRDAKSGTSNLKEHRPKLDYQRKHQSQPSTALMSDENDRMVNEEDFLGSLDKIRSRDAKSGASNLREYRPKLVHQRKNQSQSSITAMSDETDQMVHEENPVDAHIPGNYSGEISEIDSKYIYMNRTCTVHRKGTSEMNPTEARVEGDWNGSQKKFQRKRGYSKTDYSMSSEFRSFCNSGTYRKRSFSARMSREMIKRYMENIKSRVNKEQPLAIDWWNKIRAENFSNGRDTSGVPSVDEEENSEIDMLFQTMELCMASASLLEDIEGSNVEVPAEVAQDRSEDCGELCQHEYKLNEEIGILCRLCGSVKTEIKDVLPTFFQCIPNKGSCNEEHNQDEEVGFGLFGSPAASNTPLSEEEENVWVLIPDLKRKLHFHQKRAFEFLWRNIAGSLVPTLIEPKVKNTGGCVISHSPGAGKTLLIIAFLVSYLKLYPGSRPVVLAPKTTLCTWYKEIVKWEFPVPVYQIHSRTTCRGQVLRKELRISQDAPKANQDFIHVVDGMEKICKWLEHSSVLLMSYTSFLTLTREDSKFAHRKYVGQVLRECAGILILDEGHNPRSTNSRLRNALMKVKTKLRILLSGTLFQNNFAEYFNTLALARPSFVDEVLKKLDPKFKRRRKGLKTRFSLETRARKFFIDKIAKKVDSSEAEERMQALNMLRNLTSRFIDVYDGGSSDNLPGLQCYTLMMKLTPLQQELLIKLKDQSLMRRQLEFEFLITLVSIHPWLTTTTPASRQYFSIKELEDLDKCKSDPKLGSKVRFVISLVPRCIIREEKVLIFCHNIASMDLFVDIFESLYGWKKGRDVLVLRGEIELFERGRIMDKFEEPRGASKVMLASIMACAEGISLTAASRVILLDSEWNPSKRKQAIARAFRPGQGKVVYVYQLLATGTLEEEKFSRTTWKEWVSGMIFSEDLVEDPWHCQAEKIEDDVLREILEEDRAALFHTIMINEHTSNGAARGK